MAFWRRIYNPADAYGGEVITGWAARLYPYLTIDGVAGEPNPLLDLPIDQPRDLTPAGNFGYQGPGIRSDAVPATLSKVTVDVNDITGKTGQITHWITCRLTETSARHPLEAKLRPRPGPPRR